MQGGFRDWLRARGLDHKTITTQLSQAGRLESHLGDLDVAFDADRFQRMRASLEYSKKDERAGRDNPAPFPIDGDLYSNLASYRTTLNYYSKFLEGRANVPEIGVLASHHAEADSENASVIDLNKFRLERLINGAKKRGFVTYSEINDAFPQDKMSADQIKDAMSAISEVGIEIVEKIHRVKVSLDGEALERMRVAFLDHFPDFEKTGFVATEGRYWEEERRYKQVLIDQAATILASHRSQSEKGADLIRLLGSELSNLLDWRELQRLDRVNVNSSLISEAVGMLAFSTADAAIAVTDFVELVWPAYSSASPSSKPYADMRVIPTTILALVHPTRAIAVRYQPFQTAGRALLHKPVFRNGPLTYDEYRSVLDMAVAIETTMRTEWGWSPRDLWDVQGFIWVTHYSGDRAARAQEPDSIDVDQTDDRYRTQADVPAWIDALERRPFATVLAARISDIRNGNREHGPDGDQAFMVHLHGPWGSGKSSILNLLQEELAKQSKPSLVVQFNAWKHQRMRPPWWALMTVIYHGAIRRCAGSTDERERWGGRFSLWRLWWSWRWKAEIFPILLVALLVAGLTFTLLGTNMGGVVEMLSKVGATALVVMAAVYTYARLMIFGSQKAVQTYADLTTDPYRRIVDLFNRLVNEIAVPLVVFIDDLDRCDSDYVVELLEGIQTLLRKAPVIYVVAADRKWICSSFEKKYSDFATSIGEPSRPLGYLFLDKLFQISAEMPRLTREIQAAYLAGLLRPEPPEARAIDPAIMEAAEMRVSGISDEAELQRLVEAAKEEDVSTNGEQESLDRQRALRAAAAMQITSAEAARETEHRLQKFSHLLEPNPRSMKRLVNAVGMAQARGILEGRLAAPETRARWAMLSLRWPVLAEFIADNPDVITSWRKPTTRGKQRTQAKADLDWPESVRKLHGNSAVMAVVGAEGEEGALTPESLAPLLA